MLDFIKDWWGQILVGGLVLIGYGTQSQQLRSYRQDHLKLRKDFDGHRIEHSKSNVVTLDELTSRQIICQRELTKELVHIRELLEFRLATVEKDIDEIKKELHDKK